MSNELICPRCGSSQLTVIGNSICKDSDDPFYAYYKCLNCGHGARGQSI